MSFLNDKSNWQVCVSAWQFCVIINLLYGSFTTSSVVIEGNVEDTMGNEPLSRIQNIQLKVGYRRVRVTHISHLETNIKQLSLSLETTRKPLVTISCTYGKVLSHGTGLMTGTLGGSKNQLLRVKLWKFDGPIKSLQQKYLNTQ